MNEGSLKQSTFFPTQSKYLRTLSLHSLQKLLKSGHQNQNDKHSNAVHTYSVYIIILRPVTSAHTVNILDKKSGRILQRRSPNFTRIQLRRKKPSIHESRDM